MRIQCEEVIIEDAVWFTVGPVGGTVTERSEWLYDADTWATENLGQGWIGLRPRGLDWQQDCTWLIHESKFWFRDPEDMFIFFLAVTP